MVEREQEYPLKPPNGHPSEFKEQKEKPYAAGKGRPPNGLDGRRKQGHTVSSNKLFLDCTFGCEPHF